MIDSIKHLSILQLSVIVLYVIPFIISFIVAIYFNLKKYITEYKEYLEALKENRYSGSTLRIGEILFHLLISIIPVVNILSIVFRLTPTRINESIIEFLNFKLIPSNYPRR